MNSKDIRKKFIDFFVKHNHTLVPSSSLIPAQDPTLLFTNAGMNQFKDVFLGKEQRSYTRAVSIQKCIRAGGKHNDLDNVGFTKRHLTFFEMLGNFSFGDYFKHEAIVFAWEFLTQELALDKNKLYASVYKHDEEAYMLWHTVIGLPKERIVKLGEADNFWQMGDIGPCGPCSEIYIDRGPHFGCGQTECTLGCSCDRFLEIWNLVFMQYDRQPDGTDKSLKQTGVDTGMGLERLTAVLQEKDSVFETDLFTPLLERIERLTGITYTTADTQIQAAFRVLADHIRSSCFALADGGVPANEGRGYVIRKIIRRAALFAQKLSTKNIFPALAPAVIDSMGNFYPELHNQSTRIQAVLTSEIEKFSLNLLKGQEILQDYFRQNQESHVISGAQAFKLYDTYGFPLELTQLIAQQHNFAVDTQAFESHMEQQRIQSGKKIKTPETCPFDQSLMTHFTGYDQHISQTTITGLLIDNKPVEQVPAHTLCTIITPESPFYVECGGQISDQGTVKIDTKIDTHETKLLGLTKIGNAIGAIIETPVTLNLGDNITLLVDSPSRINTMKNHTATHLLQAALVELLGPGVKQAGSVVTPEYLRFDFTYHENLTSEQIYYVEDLVNKKIFENIPVKTEHTTLDNALARGVIAFFGEKYNPERVRIVEIPGFSAELCGGTHVRATGDIGIFKITEVSALSAGTRRLVALTGPGALRAFQESFNTTKKLGQEFKVTQEQVLDTVLKQKEQLMHALKQIKELKKQAYKARVSQWLSQAKTIKSIPAVYLSLEADAAHDLKDIAQELLKAQPGFYFLVAQTPERAYIYSTLSPELAHKISLKQLGTWLKEQNIAGGGSGNTYQAGTQVLPTNLQEQVYSWLEQNIQQK